MLDERLIGTGTIIAVLSNGNEYHFSYNMREKALVFVEKQKRIVRMNVKPNPLILYDDGQEECLKTRGCEPIALEYHIDPELVQVLLNDGFIYYSSSSADLYGLPREQAFDYMYHQNDYRRRHTKERNLAFNRLGIF